MDYRQMRITQEIIYCRTENGKEVRHLLRHKQLNLLTKKNRKNEKFAQMGRKIACRRQW